jgi:hypothetical protein
MYVHQSTKADTYVHKVCTQTYSQHIRFWESGSYSEVKLFKYWVIRMKGNCATTHVCSRFSFRWKSEFPKQFNTNQEGAAKHKL